MKSNEIVLIEMGIRSFLEGLVMKRYKNMTELKKYLKDNMKEFIVELVDKDLTGYDEFIDYEFVGSFQNRKLDLLCDFDIYYAKTRANEIIITEVGYEFE